MGKRGERDENALVAWLAQQDATGGLIGDDAAFLGTGGPLAATVDSQVAGVHFPADLAPAHVARRLLAVNLSDLAAVGAKPRYGLLALSVPEGFRPRLLLEPLLEECARAGVRLAGGDIAGGERLVASLTLLGGRLGKRWLERKKGRPDETLWVGGTLGAAALGCRLIADGARPHKRGIRLPGNADLSRRESTLAKRCVRRHLRPRPQLELSRWLAGQKAGAVIDVSDGLARDLHRLCRASKCGAVIEAAALPIEPGMAKLATRLGCEAAELALFGGEDYVLLFSLPAGSRPPKRLACHRIGRLVAGSEVDIVLDGASHPLPDRGWDHLEAG